MKKILALIISIILSVLLYNITNAVVCDFKAMEKSANIKTNITLDPNIRFLTVKRWIYCNWWLYIFLGWWTVNNQYFFSDEKSNKKGKWSSIQIPEKPWKWERILVNRNDSNDIVYVYWENYSNSNIINFFYKYKLNYLILFLIITSLLIFLNKKKLIIKN